jgi:predicted transcriptional regulator
MTRQAVTKHLILLEAANLVATVWRWPKAATPTAKQRR